MKRPGGRRKIVVAALAAILILAIGRELTDGSVDAPSIDCSRYRFDPAAWHADDDRFTGELTPRHREELTPRQREADRLIACRTLIGASRRDVLALLGRADENDGEGLAYQLGSERGPAKVDSEYLDVVIRDGKVVKLSLFQG